MSNFKELTQEQFDIAPGVYGSSTNIPVFTVDSKGKITSISVVSAPSYINLISAVLTLDKLVLLFDQNIDPESQPVLSFNLGLTALSSEIVKDKLTITLSKNIWKGNELRFSIASGLKSLSTGLFAKPILDRVAQNKSPRASYIVTDKVTTTNGGLGASIALTNNAQLLVSTMLSEQALFVYRLSDRAEKVQSIKTKNACSGDVPIAYAGEWLAIALLDVVQVFKFDRSCRSYIHWFDIDANATGIAVSNEHIFVALPESVNCYVLETKTLLSKVNIIGAKQVKAQPNSYQIAVVLPKSVYILTRRTVTDWSISNSFDTDDIDTNIAFDGETLVVAYPKIELINIYTRVNCLWLTQLQLFSMPCKTVQLEKDLIVTGDSTQNTATILSKTSYECWGQANKQLIKSSQIVDFGYSISIANKTVVIGSPFGGYVEVFKLETT